MKVNNPSKSLSLAFLHLKIVLEVPFKGCDQYILLVCLQALRKALMKQRKIFFTLLRKLF